MSFSNVCSPLKTSGYEMLLISWLPKCLPIGSGVSSMLSFLLPKMSYSLKRWFEFIRHRYKRKKSFLPFKLDMKKAYDRVKWSFFGGGWVHWMNLILECVSSVSFSIQIKSHPSGQRINYQKSDSGLARDSLWSQKHIKWLSIERGAPKMCDLATLAWVARDR